MTLCSLGRPSDESLNALDRALRDQGFTSLTAYTDSQPVASLTDLAAQLGLDVEATGTMERCARSLLARDLRSELPEGWQNDTAEHDNDITSNAFDDDATR